ncbi:MAG: LuxR family transcriptional [Rhodospirillaceae bacterium]|nr:MAG: LuxR family transcriptional [Rhodospirillaceae bacterium]TNC96306.1 MAG: LuxR family transcriptional regulator [Stygiobacter sp.]
MDCRVQNDAVIQLWDKLADFDAVKTDDACLYLMTRLADMLAAKNVGWIGAVRTADDPCDPLRGWRIAQIKYLVDDPLNAVGIEELRRRWAKREVDPLSLRTLEGAGNQFRTLSIRQTMPSDWFEQSYYKTLFESRDVYDCIFALFPLSKDAECVFSVQASSRRGAFTAEDTALVAQIVRGMKWFHRRLMLEHHLLVASTPLSPAERRTLTELLTDASEKEIAARLGLSANTVHQYAKSIYHKYGVRGRTGLMSLWLNRLG